MNDAFVVEIELEALAVNNHVLGRNVFRQRKFEYQALKNFASPEPMAFDQNAKNISQGIYLHWTFPRSMRTGYKDSREYPLLPNRWLITRICHSNTGLSKSWVLESDCPNTDVSQKFSTPFMLTPDTLQAWSQCEDPNRKDASALQFVDLGKAFPLDEWKERCEKIMFLTACAPANPEFSGYIGFNQGIFSFYDDLENIENENLSYSVIGWYSNSELDILSKNSLEELSWDVFGGAVSKEAKNSYYTGAVLSINWRRNQIITPDPLHSIADSKKLNLSIGGDDAKAFSAFVQQYVSKEFAVSISALIYDMLSSYDSVNGGAEFRNKSHQGDFSSKSGGTRWVIDFKPEANRTKPVKITEYEAGWLAEMNRCQYMLDKEVEKLKSLQWELNAAWWKQGKINEIFPNKTGFKSSDFYKLLDLNNPDSLVSKCITQMALVRSIASELPNIFDGTVGNDQEKFRREIEKFALNKGLTTDKILKAISAPRYWKPLNPSVMISGVQPPSDLNTDKSFTIRLISQLEKESPINMPDLSKLPEPVKSLLEECLWLSSGKPAPSEKLPAYAHKKWSQHWEPMYLEWKLKYYHIPFVDKNGKNNWLFDGFDYVLSPQADFGSDPIVVSGITPLSAHTKKLLSQRMKELAESIDDSKGSFSKAIEQVAGWELLSQELTGLNEYLSQRDIRAFRRPYTEKTKSGDLSFAQLCGYDSEEPVENIPLITPERIKGYDFIRSGQFYFTDLMVYDKFGRILPIVSSEDNAGVFLAENFPVIHPKELACAKKMLTKIGFPMQFPPRVLQYSRLNIDLVDGRDEKGIYARDENANPVCGWIIANHLNHSLALYAPDGESLGQLAVFQKSTERFIEWTPPIHSNIKSIEQVHEVAPHIEMLIRAMRMKTEDNFAQMLRVIDYTLWTVDPFEDTDDNLSVLMGRPLALLRCKLSFETEGEPIGETDWAATFNKPEPGFLNYPFNVRLGDKEIRKDGLIGYFMEKDYGVFNSVTAPEHDCADIVEIGGPDGNFIKLAFKGGGCVISALVDPRGQIHAYSGILPVKTLDIPNELTKETLSRIESVFNIGPFVTRIVQAPQEDIIQEPFFSVQLPKFAEKNGVWSWYEFDDAEGSEYGIEPIVYDESENPSIREGFLQFIKKEDENGK